MNVQDILPLLKGVKRYAGGWVARCPAHDDSTPSLSIAERDDQLLLYCHAGCSFESIMAKLRDGGHISGNLGNGSFDASQYLRPGRLIRNHVVAKYDYRSPSGEFLYQIVRIVAEGGAADRKTFKIRRKPRDGETPSQDGWIYNAQGVELSLYNVESVSENALIYVVEGEKDVETLKSLGLAAVCNPFGAGKWRAEYSEALRDKTVVILPDNDATGRRHAETVANSLVGIATEVLVIDLPGLAEKGDVSDFIGAGGTADDLMELVTRAETWRPKINKKDVSKGLVFTPVSDLVSEPREEIGFVWHDTLPCGGFSLCSAKPKVGKSTLARNLALAVATGSDFLGRAATYGKVLYLCLEEKRQEVRNHFERMGAVTDRILIHTGATPESVIEELAAAIEEHGPLLVIIDPLSRVVRVRDYNEYGAMTRGLEPLLDLARRSGCHIMALHHDSKLDRSGGDALLGSTALFGIVDCHIQLKKRDKVRTAATIQRYGTDLPETVLELDMETGIIRSAGDLDSVTLQKVSVQLIGLFGPETHITEGEIKEQVQGQNRGVISKALRQLVENGDLRRSGEGRRNSPFVYSLEPEN